MNIHWPSTKTNNYVPWYVILWRVPWFLVFGFCIVMACVCAAMGAGLSQGKQTWKDNL